MSGVGTWPDTGQEVTTWKQTRLEGLAVALCMWSLPIHLTQGPSVTPGNDPSPFPPLLGRTNETQAQKVTAPFSNVHNSVVELGFKNQTIAKCEIELIYFYKVRGLQGWRDGWAVKSTGCCCRGFGFIASSRDGSRPSVTLVPKDPTSALAPSDTACTGYTDSGRQNSHAHRIKNKCILKSG